MGSMMGTAQVQDTDQDSSGVMPHQFGNRMGYGGAGSMMGQGGAGSMMGYGGAGSMMGHGGMGSMMGYGGNWLQSGLAEKLGLSQEQIDKLDEIHLQAQADIIRQSAEARIVRLELRNLLTKDDWNQKEAEAQVRKLGEDPGRYPDPPASDPERHPQVADRRAVETARQLRF